MTELSSNTLPTELSSNTLPTELSSTGKHVRPRVTKSTNIMFFLTFVLISVLIIVFIKQDDIKKLFKKDNPSEKTTPGKTTPGKTTPGKMTSRKLTPGSSYDFDFDYETADRILLNVRQQMIELDYNSNLNYLTISVDQMKVLNNMFRLVINDGVACQKLIFNQITPYLDPGEHISLIKTLENTVKEHSIIMQKFMEFSTSPTAPPVNSEVVENTVSLIDVISDDVDFSFDDLTMMMFMDVKLVNDIVIIQTIQDENIFLDVFDMSNVDINMFDPVFLEQNYILYGGNDFNAFETKFKKDYKFMYAIYKILHKSFIDGINEHMRISFNQSNPVDFWRAYENSKYFLPPDDPLFLLTTKMKREIYWMTRCTKAPIEDTTNSWNAQLYLPVYDT
jgi:hypothetical protein